MYCPECSQDKESKGIGLCGECYQALKAEMKKLEEKCGKFEGMCDNLIDALDDEGLDVDYTRKAFEKLREKEKASGKEETS